MPLNFNIDSWFWKFAVVFALLGIRAFVSLLSPKDKHVAQNETAKWLTETIDSAAIAIGLVLFIIQPFILQAFYIPSGSMEDTLRIQDRLLVSKLVYRLKEPQFQDVVVFKAPPEAKLNNSNPEEEIDFIKRCMGVAGDVIEVRDRRVFRNGTLVKEPYTKWSDAGETINTGAPDSLVGTLRQSYDMKIYEGAVYSRDYDTPSQPGLWKKNGIAESEADQETITNAKPGKVPQGSFLMLGDHRKSSHDSHVWGFVPRANIVGKAICVFWPPTRLGLVDNMSVNQTPKE
jgi:signal peptidase I